MLTLQGEGNHCAQCLIASGEPFAIPLSHFIRQNWRLLRQLFRPNPEPCQAVLP